MWVIQVYVQAPWKKIQLARVTPIGVRDTWTPANLTNDTQQPENNWGFFNKVFKYICPANDSSCDSFPLSCLCPIPKDCHFLLRFSVTFFLLLSIPAQALCILPLYEIFPAVGSLMSVLPSRIQAPLAPDRWSQCHCPCPTLPPSISSLVYAIQLFLGV